MCPYIQCTPIIVRLDVLGGGAGVVHARHSVISTVTPAGTGRRQVTVVITSVNTLPDLGLATRTAASATSPRRRVDAEDQELIALIVYS